MCGKVLQSTLHIGFLGQLGLRKVAIRPRFARHTMYHAPALPCKATIRYSHTHDSRNRV